MSDRHWRAVVCARPLGRAKSRLAPFGDEAREALARAMTHDVLETLRGTANVSEVVLVSDDPSLAHLARVVDAVVLPDPGRGLNPAFLHGMTGLPEHVWTAMLVTDLPCLTSRALERVLCAAAQHRVAVVADRAGTGTTLLTTAPGSRARPGFGPESFVRHIAGGAVPVGRDERGARCDVDTEADLGVALDLGLGCHTARVLVDLRLDTVGLNAQLCRSEG